MKGIVKSFSDLHGYGFIRGEDGKDYFVHQTCISKIGFRTLYLAEEVEFDAVNTQRGVQAQNVKTIVRSVPSTKVSEEVPRIKIRKNPFTPQDPISLPSKFAGRSRETVTALQGLIDGENLLIQGPRGIGKSSFSQQLVKILGGNFELLEKNGIDTSELRLNNITCSYRCVPGNTLLDIANALIKVVRCETTGQVVGSDVTRVKKFSLGDIEQCTINVEKNLSLNEIANDFFLTVRQLCSNVLNEKTGLTFLIDEIDVLDKDILIAPFLKAVCEALSSSNLNHNFILCGVTGTVTRLIREHKSSNRLFLPIELIQLGDDEIFELINLALEGSGVGIEDAARRRISYLSNRFPHPAQQLGYFAFQECSGNVICYKDVENAKMHITTRIKNQEFTNKWTKFKESAQSQILQAMASDERDIYTLTWIKKELKTLTNDQIIGALINLNREEIIDRIGQDFSQYTFREPLFKIYLQWTYQIE